MDQEYLSNFEAKLLNELLKVCKSRNMLDGTLLATDDIDNLWDTLAPEYMADAVPEIRDYPLVSVGWAAYLGMGVAFGWDANWELFSTAPYKTYHGVRGFDDLDEHVMFDMLKIERTSAEALAVEKLFRQCGECAVSLIRHEQIEPQSPMAFYVFARACRAMYRIGAAVQLRRMGYKFQKM